MVALNRVTSVVGGGTFSLLYLPRVRTQCDQLGATGCLLTQGVLELNRATNYEPTRFGRAGVIDVSPSRKELRNAIGNVGSIEIAESNRGVWAPLAQGLVDRIIKAYLNAKLVDGQMLWPQGLRTGHSLPADEALRELKQRMPKLHVVGLSVIPDDADKRERIRDGYDLFHRLKEDDVVSTTILLDNASPFAKTYTLEAQDRFSAKALASILVAQSFIAKSQSLGEIGRSLGDYAVFAGMSFRSRSLVAGREPRVWSPLRGVFGLPERGYGNLGNTVQEAILATTEAISRPDSFAIEGQVDQRKPFFVVYTVPIRPDDAQKWISFSNQVRCWLANEHPKAIPIFASGSGTPRPGFQSSYWLQVSTLFPLPDIPVPIQQILKSENLKRRRMPRTDSKTGNGRPRF
jgi:hypothetical protein